MKKKLVLSSVVFAILTFCIVPVCYSFTYNWNGCNIPGWNFFGKYYYATAWQVCGDECPYMYCSAKTHVNYQYSPTRVVEDVNTTNIQADSAKEYYCIFLLDEGYETHFKVRLTPGDILYQWEKSST